MSIRIIEQNVQKPCKSLREIAAGGYFKYGDQIFVRCGEITNGKNELYYVRYFGNEEVTECTSLKGDTQVIPIKIKEIIYEV